MKAVELYGGPLDGSTVFVEEDTGLLEAEENRHGNDQVIYKYRKDDRVPGRFFWAGYDERLCTMKGDQSGKS